MPLKLLSKRLKTILLYILIFALLIIFLLPIFWMANMAVQSTEDAFKLQLFPRNITFEQFAWLLGQSDILRAFMNSLIVAVGTTLIAIFLSLMGAYGFSRFKYYTIGMIILLFIVSTKMFPPVLLAISYFDILSLVNGLDSKLFLIIIDTMYVIPFTVWMLKNYLDSIPASLDEAAMIDGCSRAGVLFRVLLPITAPGLVATITYSFLLAWNEYLYALTFITSNSNKLVTVSMTELIGQWWTNIPQLMAYSLLAAVPLIIIFLTIQKYLIAGLTASAEKG